MTAIHTKALAIFGDLLHNEAEEKINFVKFSCMIVNPP